MLKVSNNYLAAISV